MTKPLPPPLLPAIMHRAGSSLFAVCVCLNAVNLPLLGQSPDNATTPPAAPATPPPAPETAPALPDDSSSDAAPEPAAAAAASDPPPDWAAEVLAADPLAGKESVSLEDLQDALADPQQRQWVIERHLPRAELTKEARLQFLRDAFDHPNLQVRQQAAMALQRQGDLKQVVREILLDWIRAGDTPQTEHAIVALQSLPVPVEQFDANVLDALLRALAADAPKVQGAAAQQLQRLGPAAVPVLLDAIASEETDALAAAEVLSRLLAPTFDLPERALEMPPAAFAPPSASTPAVRSKGSPLPASPQALAREVDRRHAEAVRVYYGTNRELLNNPPDPTRRLLTWGAVFLVLLVLLAWRIGRLLRHHAKPPKHRVAQVVLLLFLSGAAIWVAGRNNTAFEQLTSLRQGVEFGGHRSSNGSIYYGYCDVSIPPTHSVGKVERPLVGPEDEAKHVVLQQAALLEEAAFYDAVNAKLGKAGDTSADCLLYIHGYNVAFDDAARRAAQIHFDLEFEGVTMFYSWPSRGRARHYFSDRNEIRFSDRLIKQFLEGAKEHLEFNRFHVIAHSMGADALCQAIEELDPEKQFFDQLVLAAPDIDAELFRQQILPQLQKRSQRTTLYCSRNDWALHASQRFNDAPRAGDSRNGPLVAPGLDTIDASEMDTELLGHSYYGDCLPLLDDLELLIKQNRSPDERRLEPFFEASGLPYWLLLN